ncbi:diguanylate cyclase [Sinorhizobium sp. BG8]|uniref:GGDEF domain-containing protein n=1 Tax=Sinorhizobium sp. BG8 TaxID=2613773 RepID=UPI00193E60C3|nr:diguanylate cyclase [Sinorhizobium sp. BG8]
MDSSRKPGRRLLRVAGIAAGGGLAAMALALVIQSVLYLALPEAPVLAGFLGTGVVALLASLPLLSTVLWQGETLRLARMRRSAELGRDAVTKVMNGRVFSAQVEHFAEQRIQTGENAGGIVVGVTVGGLDAINRHYGHEWGDEVMRSLAAIIRASVRKGDLVARIGFNQFGILLAGADAKNAQVIGARILKRVSDAAFSAAEAGPGMDILIGGVLFEEPIDFTSLHRMLDEAAQPADPQATIHVPVRRVEDIGMSAPI